MQPRTPIVARSAVSLRKICRQLMPPYLIVHRSFRIETVSATRTRSINHGHMRQHWCGSRFQQKTAFHSSKSECWRDARFFSGETGRERRDDGTGGIGSGCHVHHAGHHSTQVGRLPASLAFASMTATKRRARRLCVAGGLRDRGVGNHGEIFSVHSRRLILNHGVSCCRNYGSVWW